MHIAGCDDRAGDSSLKFTLTYEGSLRTGKARGADDGTPGDRKWALRIYFHEQLRRLWSVNALLKSWHKQTKDRGNERMEDYLAKEVPPIASQRFVPLVSRAACVDCWLDLRILRSREDPQNSPDIDNQVKLLFDGLKKPQDKTEMGQNHRPTSGPLYVLLEDDSLVSKLTSTQDELLQPICGKQVVENNDVRILIDVHVRPQVPTADNLIFYSDDASRWDHYWYDGLPENFSRLGDTAMRAVATQCIFRIRALSETFSSWRRPHLREFLPESHTLEEWRAAWKADMDGRQSDGEAMRRIWLLNLWPKARDVRSELNRRIHGGQPHSYDELSAAFDHGMLAGPHPLEEVAAELESLVRRLG